MNLAPKSSYWTGIWHSNFITKKKRGGTITMRAGELNTFDLSLVFLYLGDKQIFIFSRKSVNLIVLVVLNYIGNLKIIKLV